MNVVFGDCIYNARDLVSFWVGIASICAWLVCTLPQIIENFRRGSAEALSPIFLVQWFIGDGCNLVGAFLTHQLPTQKFLAVYFVLVDIVLLGQLLFFNCSSKRKFSSLNGTIGPDPTENTRLLSIKLLFALLGSGAILTAAIPSTPGPPGRRRSESGGVEYLQIIGMTIGWISAAFYLTSRLPQIWKNFRRRSTEGLSWVMFLMAVLGNTLYTASILIRSVDKDYILGKLPWLIGSSGTLGFDILIFVQFWLYRKNFTLEGKQDD